MRWPVVRLAALLSVTVAGTAQTLQEVWERITIAKGGRARLESVTALAIYTSPARNDPTAGPRSTWLCVFPDRYFNWSDTGFWTYPVLTPKGRETGGTPRSIIVDAGKRRIAMDANGTPRIKDGILSPLETDQVVFNQLIFLLETKWLKPRPVALSRKRNHMHSVPVLTVEAGVRTFEIYLDPDTMLPQRISSPAPAREYKDLKYDWRLARYGDFRGILLPTRITYRFGKFGQFVWDVDYEINPKYNPKLFDGTPDLVAGPEPWRR